MKIEQEFSVRARCGPVLRGSIQGARRFAGYIAGYLAARASRSVAAILIGEMPSSTRDGKAFFVKQPLDFEDGLDIFTPIEAVTAGAFHGL